MKMSVVAAALAAAPLAASAADAATIQVISGQQRAFQLNVSGGSAGQSFVAVDSVLSSIGFQFEGFAGGGNIAAPNLSYAFTLLTGAGLGGATVATRTFTVPTSIGVNMPSWVDIDISGTAVTVGQTYTGVLTSANAKFGVLVGPDINIYTGAELSGDAYPAGRAYFPVSPYPNCPLTGNCDLNFRVTGSTPAATAVPEPASWALMLGGLGLAGAALRRRRAVVSVA